MTNSITAYFGGKERLEQFPALARMIRMGSAAELAVGDKERALGAIDRGDWDLAKSYVDLFQREYVSMAALLSEWCLEMPNTLAKILSSEEERAISRSASTRFLNDLRSIGLNADLALGSQDTAKIFHPDVLRPGVSDQYRKDTVAGTPTIAHSFLDRIAELNASLMKALAAKKADEAKRLFNEHRDYSIGVHDACVQYTQSYPAEVAIKKGQETVERLVRESFSACSFFEGLWAVAGLPPLERAAFLAEHLRSHFSGKGRAGSVNVVEDEKRYRLVYDACGSGGAMRRRQAGAGEATEKLPKATPATWNRAGEVPPYCIHCAFNEITSVSKFGYPVFVTEFNPDPAKPCGWTVYKKPEEIPEEYFSRIGVKRDPSLFKKL